MLIFAHRGASAYAPENTLPAFRKALDMGARAIELDVQLSSDGVPVVIHDFFLNKTTDGSGMVRDLNWKTLRTLDAGRCFSRDFQGTRIPSLEEVLDVVPEDVILNIELKTISLFRERTAAAVLDLLDQESGKRQVVISSFNHSSLRDVRDRDQKIRIGLLTASHMLNFSEYVKSTGLAPWSLHPEVSYLTPDYVETAHREGWKVYCWTVNSPQVAGMVNAAGADGFFSDDPGLKFQ